MILSVCITVFSLSAYHIYDYWKETQDSQRQNDVLIDKAVETAPQTQQTENGQTESAIKPVSETAPITVDFERLQEGHYCLALLPGYRNQLSGSTEQG